MKTFLLDLASSTGLLACVDEGRVVAARPADARVRDEELVPLAQSLLAEAGWAWEGLSGIACTVGPGGFTSLRVGVACANAWGDAYGLPLAGVHLSDLHAARAAGSDALWLHSTKRAELFVRGFGAFTRQWKEPSHALIDDLLPRLPGGAPWIGELLPDHARLLRDHGHEPLPVAPLEDILPDFLAGLAYARGQLEPWYGREG